MSSTATTAGGPDRSPAVADADGADPQAPAPRRGWKGRLADVSWPEVAAPLALVALVIGFGLADSGFLSSSNVVAMLQAATILVVLVLGQTFVVSTAGIDLSVASTMTFAAVALGQAYTATESIWVAMVAAIGAGALVGCINGVLIAKGGITDFVVSLGMLSAASGMALVLSDGKPTQIIDSVLLTLTVDGLGPITYAVMLAALLAVLAHVVLFHTPFGLHILAVGGSPRAARATGVRTDAIKIAAYGLSGTTAGIAAILLVGRVGAAEPAANTSFLLNCVAAVVLGGVSLFGGRATILGPVAGALLLTALVNGLTRFGISEFYQPVAVGVVVVAAAFLARFER